MLSFLTELIPTAAFLEVQLRRILLRARRPILLHEAGVLSYTVESQLRFNWRSNLLCGEHN